MNASTIESASPKPESRITHGGYVNALIAACGHTLLMILRRQRLILAAVITFLPALIPLAMAFLSASQFADNGAKTFVFMAENAYINMLAPLLALFFACMLVGEDAEAQTIPYVLTRPMARSAWVLGKFVAYVLVAYSILLVSLAMNFAACTALADFGFNAADLGVLAHYSGIAFLGLLAYGAVSVFLGATTRRPIVVGVILLYGWQRVARLVPGLIDFLTIEKYTDALLPRLASQRASIEVQTALGTFQKEVFLVSAAKAGATLIAITAVFLGMTVLAVRWRQYSSTRAIGS